MGNIVSRKKKVAPVRASETKVHNSEKDIMQLRTSEDSDGLKIPRREKLNDSRNKTWQDGHSEGLESNFPADDGCVDIDAELDRLLVEYKGKGRDSSKTPGKDGSVISEKSESNHCKRVTGGSDFSSSDQKYNSEHYEKMYRTQDVVMKHDNIASGYFGSVLHTLDSSGCDLQSTDLNGFQERSFTKETASVPGVCEVSAVVVPIVGYDRAEEELMETIEREFC